MGSDRLTVTVVAGGAEAGGLATGLAASLAGDGVALVGPPEALAQAVEVPGVVVVPVAPATGYRSVGCACCSVRADLVDALRMVLDRRNRPRRAVVVTHHDLVGATQTLLSDADLFRRITLDGVVASCDGSALSTRLATGGPLGTEEEMATLATADVVAIVGGDRLSGAGLQRVRSAVRRVNRTGPVVSPAAGAEPFRSFVGLCAWRGRLASRPAPTTVPRDGAPSTVVLEVDGRLDAEGVRAWLDRVIDEHAPRLLRLQGELCVADHERGVDCVGIRSFVTTTGGRTLSAPASHLSLVGRELDADELLGGLRSLIAR